MKAKKIIEFLKGRPDAEVRFADGKVEKVISGLEFIPPEKLSEKERERYPNGIIYLNRYSPF